MKKQIKDIAAVAVLAIILSSAAKMADRPVRQVLSLAVWEMVDHNLMCDSDAEYIGSTFLE